MAVRADVKNLSTDGDYVSSVAIHMNTTSLSQLKHFDEGKVIFGSSDKDSAILEMKRKMHLSSDCQIPGNIAG